MKAKNKFILAVGTSDRVQISNCLRRAHAMCNYLGRSFARVNFDFRKTRRDLIKQIVILI